VRTVVPDLTHQVHFTEQLWTQVIPKALGVDERIQRNIIWPFQFLIVFVQPMNDLFQSTATQYGRKPRIGKDMLFRFPTFVMDQRPFWLEELEVV
jgi:hypothetical protein